MLFHIIQITLHGMRSNRKSPKDYVKNMADSEAIQKVVMEAATEVAKAAVLAMTQASEESRIPATCTRELPQ